MTGRDLFEMSVGNLWRVKLRSFLTISGVVIAIGAFVAMLSFAAGNQQRVEEEFSNLGLFTSMQVYPRQPQGEGDTTRAAILTDSVLSELARIEGVNMIYPYESFSVKVTVGDTQITTTAMTLSSRALSTKIFSDLVAGERYSSDSVRQAVVNEQLLEELGVDSGSLLVGKEMVIAVSVSVMDSGLAAVVGDRGSRLRQILGEVELDSLRHDEYRRRVLRRELGSAASRFMEGYLQNQALVADTVEIVGVLERARLRRTRIQPIIVPPVVAHKFDSAGGGGDPTDLIAMLQQGSVPGMSGPYAGEGYSMVTINMDPATNYATLQDTVEALGYRTFSFAQEFDEIRQAFRYFYLALAMIGFVAMFTAALGIINTLVMSITERRREIGLLKSLGADERQISVMYLAESATIGLIGGGLGVLLGWLVSRVASAIAQGIMESEGVDPIELFALPVWLIALAMGFSIVISVLAGSYPAIRAARVDPVEALRGE